VEVAILCSLAPDDTTRRAYLRNRWHGRSMDSDTRSQLGCE